MNVALPMALPIQGGSVTAGATPREAGPEENHDNPDAPLSGFESLLPELAAILTDAEPAALPEGEALLGEDLSDGLADALSEELGVDTLPAAESSSDGIPAEAAVLLPLAPEPIWQPGQPMLLPEKEPQGDDLAETAPFAEIGPPRDRDTLDRIVPQAATPAKLSDGVLAFAPQHSPTVAADQPLVGAPAAPIGSLAEAEADLAVASGQVMADAAMQDAGAAAPRAEGEAELPPITDRAALPRANAEVRVEAAPQPSPNSVQAPQRMEADAALAELQAEPELLAREAGTNSTATATPISAPAREGESAAPAAALGFQLPQSEARPEALRSAAPLRAPHAGLAEQVADDLKSAVLVEDEVTRIALRPAGLGLIELELSRDLHDRLQLSVRVQNPMVYAALRQDRAALDQLLASHAATVQATDMMQFSSGGEQSRQGGAQAQTMGEMAQNSSGFGSASSDRGEREGQSAQGRTADPARAPREAADEAASAPRAHSISIDILI